MTETQDTHDPRETPPSQNINASPEAAPGGTTESATEADVSPSLAALITSIRAAVTRGASPEARAAGATACRSILTVLEAKLGQPLTATPPLAASPTSPIAALLSQPGFLQQLAAMSREQLLDLLKQITGAMPARTQIPASAGPRFHLIQIPRVRRPDGT